MTTITLPDGVAIEPFIRRIEFGSRSECWPWKGARTPTGYGCWSYRRAGVTCSIGAHRLSHLIFKGEIPVGMQIDHLCCNRGCVNPAHLEAVTPAENSRRTKERGRSATGERTRNGSKTHCPQGHPYAGDNLYEACGRRYCGTCQSAQRKRVA